MKRVRGEFDGDVEMLEREISRKQFYDEKKMAVKRSRDSS